ncbi:MAG: hypothetical protein KKA44_05470 [Alphaproteobacteria bacterium]|nr:hypothetical protein [Alphaproteobacteria bacterium]MBU0864099.1 hypothetical protein [Alphaproteobacteria bacterium]MBU1824411.1 hypothetical protein [Alphaproteobacteria bacterium]
MRRTIVTALALLLSAPAAAETLLIGNKGEDTLSLVALASGEELARLPTGKMPHEIAVSPDGKQAAVVAYGATTIDVFDVAARGRSAFSMPKRARRCGRSRCRRATRRGR